MAPTGMRGSARRSEVAAAGVLALENGIYWKVLALDDALDFP
jgi:hypothetical protein